MPMVSCVCTDGDAEAKAQTEYSSGWPRECLKLGVCCDDAAQRGLSGPGFRAKSAKMRVSE